MHGYLQSGTAHALGVLASSKVGLKVPETLGNNMGVVGGP